MWVTVCVTASWVGATHCIKYLYLRRPSADDIDDDPILVPHDTTGVNMTVVQARYVSELKKLNFTPHLICFFVLRCKIPNIFFYGKLEDVFFLLHFIIKESMLCNVKKSFILKWRQKKRFQQGQKKTLIFKYNLFAQTFRCVYLPLEETR